MSTTRSRWWTLPRRGDGDEERIVIDHNTRARTEHDVAFSEIRLIARPRRRPDEVHSGTDLNLDQSVATALLIIRAETLDFKRDTTPADLTAAAYPYPFADHDTLEQVESPSMSPETLDVLAEAIGTATYRAAISSRTRGSSATATR